jgi:peroxiredoxin
VPAGPKAGKPAPLITLKDLSGKTIKVKDFKGQKTLVLFWNPGRGFCQQILDDLKKLDRNPAEEAPRYW